jgi:hypothetical protein
VEMEVEFFYYHFYGDVHPSSYDVDQVAFFSPIPFC